ncbi:MAG: riboflavin synthase [Aestuariivita sp.]|nr:riboflavin synthase [Aestuariivita sp.]
MFTGIITDIGIVISLEHVGDMRVRIATNYDINEIDIGSSIASDGVCLTVVQTGNDWYEAQVSHETISKTNLSSWVIGRRINLERALRIGDELGGHIVSGHVDGVAQLISIEQVGESTEMQFQVPEHLSCFIAAKGAVALNGTSLTVNDVTNHIFGVNFIPHTKLVTTWGDVVQGDMVNIEVDTVARYISRLSGID